MKILALTFLSLFSVAAFAQTANGEGEGRQANSQSEISESDRRIQEREERQRSAGINRHSYDCYKSLEEKRGAYVLAADATSVTRTTQALQSALACRPYELAAYSQGMGLNVQSTRETTDDGRITCSLVAGYTLDYKSCMTTKQMYNMVVTADAALDLAQGVQANQSTTRMTQEVQQRTASGDGQNAALDATIAQNRQLSQMHSQKAMAYSAAVAALAEKIARWQSDSDEAMTKLCQAVPGDKNVTGPVVPGPGRTQVEALGKPFIDCANELKGIRGRPDVFANHGAKSSFKAALMMYAAKAVKAGIDAHNLSKIAQQVENIKEETEGKGPTQFEKCLLTPLDPACQTTSDVPVGESFTPGNFTIGDGFGNNVINPNPITDNPLTSDTLAPTDSEKVADINSPFEDDAKVASGILNPAGEAETKAGGAPAGGGGGAGGGLGGGGSASLGNDLQGADAGDGKPKDIKAGQTSGAYAYGGGKGFQAVKGMRDEKNPFASLFDSKASGGIEEDRSIASEGGKDSGLFKRISKKYEQIQADKRVEALNVE